MKFVSFLLFFCLWSWDVLAEHPIEVQRSTANAQYFEALTLYEKLPRRTLTPATVEAAAKSAWGLGLAEQAIEHLEQLHRHDDFSPEKKARLHLMRGTIELQEGRPRIALLAAERAFQHLPEPSQLRGAVSLLWGDAFAFLQQYGIAEKRYREALEEVAYEIVPDVAYRLGGVYRKLGDTTKAIDAFKNVPVSHERAPEAIRSLAQLSLQEKDYPALQLWIERGKELYPDRFIDSWSEYALGRAAAEQRDLSALREIRLNALKKYPPSDLWISLLDALAEKAEWNSKR
ncbi:hypothetical protein MRY87_06575 [bacterium]|nr:hypothetical protein [bacterium]